MVSIVLESAVKFRCNCSGCLNIRLCATFIIMCLYVLPLQELSVPTHCREHVKRQIQGAGANLLFGIIFD